MTENYANVVCKKKRDDEWDRFVESVPDSHFEQTTGWATANKMRGWTTWRLYLKSNNEIVAGIQIAFLKYPVIGRIGQVVQGPLLRNDDQELLKLLLNSSKVFLKANKFLYVAYVIPYHKEWYVKIMQSSGLKRRPFGLPPTFIVEDTLYLNLKKDITELWKDVSPGRRRNIKKGLKAEPVFREGSRDDIKVFHDLMLTMCDRRKTEPTHKKAEFFLRLWDRLADKGWFKVFLLEYEGKVVCSLVGFSVGDTFRYWKWGWSGEYPDLNLSSVLIWKTIEWAKENGFRYFDFVQVDHDVATAVKECNELTDDLKNRSFAGPTLFKIRYGGELVSTPGIYILFRNKFVRLMIMKFAVKILNNKGANKLMSFIRSFTIK